jgi:hypothetical protein
MRDFLVVHEGGVVGGHEAGQLREIGGHSISIKYCCILPTM